jgi:hypothetical protein
VAHGDPAACVAPHIRTGATSSEIWIGDRELGVCRSEVESLGDLDTAIASCGRPSSTYAAPWRDSH